MHLYCTRSRRSVRVLVVLGCAAAAGAAACADPAAPPNPGAVVEVTVDSSGGPIVRHVTVRTDQPAPVEVTYGAPGTPTLTMTADSFATVHQVVLPRLRAGRDYRVQARVMRGTSGPLEGAFRTGELPDAVRSIQMTETGAPSAPVAAIEIAAGTFMGLLLVEEAQVVGYIPVEGSLFGSTRRRNGDFVLLHPTQGLQVHRLDGSVAYRLPQSRPDSSAYGTIHHDVTASPQNTILFIANEPGMVDGEAVVGEALWEWNPEAGTVVKRWSAFDHLDWKTERGARTVAGNWLHANGVAYGSRGNVLLSMRNVDQIISIAPDFTRVEWKLGGVNGTLSLPASDRFFGQHYVTEPAPGRVLLFDNGYERPGGMFSRAIEFAIDVPRATATRVWTYRPTPDIYAALVGSARRLPGGNTTVLFGMLAGHNQSTGPIVAVEVTPAGTPVWRLAFGAGVTRLYRLTPIASLAGELPGAFR